MVTAQTPDEARIPGSIVNTTCAGVDLGAVTARVARAVRTAAGSAGDVSVLTVPSAVAYRGDDVRTGLAALRAVKDAAAEVVTGFAPLLGVAAADCAAAGWTSQRTPSQVATDFLHLERATWFDTGLRREPAMVVLAVPDGWWDGAVSGALARETLRRVLSDRSGGRDPGFVPRSVAATAYRSCREGGARRAVQLICDIGAHTVTVTLCRFDAGTITALDTESSGGPGGSAAGGQFEKAAIGLAADRLPDAERLSLVHALRETARRQHRRAGVVLARAAEVPRYQQTPVYDTAAAGHRLLLTAGQVLRLAVPVTRTITGTLSALLERHRELADEVDAVAVIGGFGSFPPVRGVMAGWMAAAAHRDDPPTPQVLDPEAVARGALMIAMGECAVHQPGARVMSMPAHRILDGQLVRERIPLARSGDPVPAVAADEGEPVIVEHTGTSWIDILAHCSDGQQRRMSVQIAPLPRGRYRCGWWPAFSGDGVIIFRPVGGGEPVLVPASALPPTEEGGT